MGEPFSMRTKLFQIYSRCNPEKLPKIDKLLETYRGREDALLRNIIQKYNLEGTDLDVFYQEDVEDDEFNPDAAAWSDAREWWVSWNANRCMSTLRESAAENI